MSEIYFKEHTFCSILADVKEKEGWIWVIYNLFCVILPFTRITSRAEASGLGSMTPVTSMIDKETDHPYIAGFSVCGDGVLDRPSITTNCIFWPCSLPTENLLYFYFAVVSRNVIRCALEGNWTRDVFLSALCYSTLFQKDWLVIRGSLGGAKTAVAPLSIRSFEYLLYNRPLVVFTLALPLYLPSTVNLRTVEPSPIDIPCANIAHPNVCVYHQWYALKFLQWAML